MTTIEWTQRPGTKGETWNPLAGCSILSPGCTHCYAMRQAHRNQLMSEALGRPSAYAGTTKLVKGKPVWTGVVNAAPDATLLKPLSWKSPRTVFVNSMSDLFHEDVPDATIDRIFAVMALTPQHTYQVLTKRSARMREWFEEQWQPALARTLPDGFQIPAETRGETRRTQVERACEPFLEALGLVDTENDSLWTEDGRCKAMQWQWPLPNLWLGVSAEPLLGPIDFTDFCNGHKFIDALRGNWWHDNPDGPNPISRGHEKIDQIIVGGESGPDARPMHPAWARSIRDQCAAAGTAFFFKQWGSHRVVYERDAEDPDWRRCSDIQHKWPDGRWLNLAGGHGFHGEQVVYVAPASKKAAGRLLDGREHNEWPQTRSARPHGEPVEP